MTTFLGMPGIPGREEQTGTARDLLEEVVERDWCIGCGACAALPDSAIEIRMTEQGRFRAQARPGADLDATGGYLRVCPFASQYDEDQLARGFLEAEEAEHTDELGSFRATLAGHVADGGFRDRGSSGGMTTWFVDRLLAEDEVDAVLHVGARGGHGDLFGYRVSTSSDEVRANAKTRYYPVEMSEVLAHVRDVDRRYAVVGLPCFIKAVRLLQVEDPVFAERVRYCVGLVCGHLKSTRFADAMAWQQGVTPGELTAIDFRKKTATRADAYAIETVDRHGVVRSAPNHEHVVADWGMGMFKYSACEWCDDVTAETADISFGDAWLPGYRNDPRGANVAVVRSPQAQGVVDRAAAALAAEEVGPDQVAASQAAGLRHRREGLAHRLEVRRRQGLPTPRKRVQPSADIPEGRQRIYELRSELLEAVDASYSAGVVAGRFSQFRRRIMPSVARYEHLYETDAKARLKGVLRRQAPGLRVKISAAVSRLRAQR